MSTNLEYRERERQRKRENRRQATRKSAMKELEREIRSHFLFEEQNELVTAVNKIEQDQRFFILLLGVDLSLLKETRTRSKNFIFL